MRIEILFPEICNLYGDLANIRFLRACLPDAEVIKTTLQRRPTFLSDPVDLVYMGTTTESGQLLALDQLRFYRDEIFRQIKQGTNFLVTGNAMELFGARIEEDGEEVTKGLGLFPGVARRSSVNRFNSLFLGDFYPEGIPKAGEAGAATSGAGSQTGAAGTADAANTNSAAGTTGLTSAADATDAANDNTPIRIVGYKSQFGHMYGMDPAELGEAADAYGGSGKDAGDFASHGLDELALFVPERGPGLNRYAGGEGIRICNFFATYVIGPLLILNPPFTKWFIRNQLGQPLEELAFEQAAMDSYENRVAEYADPKTGLYYWGGTTERWT